MPPLLLVASAVALGWILLPFYGAILWALIIAMLFVPVYRWLLPRLKQRPNVAAGLVMLLVLVVGVLPFAVVTASLGREASGVYKRIDSGDWNPALYLRGLFDALPAWAAALLERAGVADFDNLQRQVTAALAQGSQFIATQAFGIGIDTFGFVASLGVALYLAFFLVRDGDELARIAKMALPVSPQFKHELIAKFLAVVRATVKGSLLVAGIQGTLGGLAFWFLGVKGALLWAVVMAFLSLLPMIGAGLVWVPVAAYFLLSGQTWQGLALVAYGVFVIGLADNLLRPRLVGKDAGMPDYVVMITTLGGMAVFGINGFIIGPTIAAMFIAVWHLSIAGRFSDQPHRQGGKFSSLAAHRPQFPQEKRMKIQLNTDVHIHGTEALAAEVNATVGQALARFEEHITRVEVHLSDENGGKSGPHDHRCMLEARLEGRQPVAVTDHADTLEQAVHGAAHKLAHLLDSTLGRLHDHREKTSGLPLSGTEPAQR